METGFRGTFVISWHQTVVDGQKAATIDTLSTGAIWRWGGKAVRVDGPNEILSLGMAEGATDLRKRAARKVRQLVGAVLEPAPKITIDDMEIDDPLLDSRFVVTNGRRTYTITFIDTGPDTSPLLMMLDEMPPCDTDLWVVRTMIGEGHAPTMQPGGVVCFTPGTRLATPDGARPVEELREGDHVLTRDGGAQDIRWIGQRRMTGARLYALPHLRPIRIRADAMQSDEPDGDLFVSPDHRILIRGAKALALFNTPEVLVAARDLINDDSITVAHGLKHVTYIHLLLDQHHILWANGVECDSFHPANASFDAIAGDQRARLLDVLPDIESDPHGYGHYARRNLSASEAAILHHDG